MEEKALRTSRSKYERELYKRKLQHLNLTDTEGRYPDSFNNFSSATDCPERLWANSYGGFDYRYPPCHCSVRNSSYGTPQQQPKPVTTVWTILDSVRNVRYSRLNLCLPSSFVSWYFDEPKLTFITIASEISMLLGERHGRALCPDAAFLKIPIYLNIRSAINANRH